ncbi:hypothetical protein CH296_14695 [Rhodococcus sp. 14-2496-1d]|uniref:DUF559 domain-containing protein n=1 Tax=Rhodococcus sp. 14-2496-1d TaxID=2023146 RepID=UPI000B9A3073|nr:DUF559 domain-containing protein [Rhodococcus sp. 14-2496-1d]OZF31444.1 hypothetical protein CH296_14695 [Rhodococcus sp. 14-2496-1d]
MTADSTPAQPGHSAGSTPAQPGHSAGSTPGPATFRQLVSSGLHPSTVSRRFTRVLPTVHMRGEPSTMDRCRAIALWRPDAVLSHRSAAYLRGWTTEPSTLDATVPRSARLRPPPWLRLHRRALDSRLVDEVESLPCTTPAQTMLDCLAVLPREEAELLIDERLKFGLDPASLICLLERFPGRRGNAELARQVRLAVTRFASEPERALGRALHRIGLYLEMNATVGSFVCDLVDRRSRTIIEVDGREFHSAAEVFSKDRRRQNALVLGGWLVLRYSAFDVLAAPDVVAAEIASVVRRRRESRR